MATTYYADIQKLYVAYFNRPADPAGLQFWERAVEAANGSTAAISAEFSASKEYTEAYANMTAYQIVNKIYQNLFGRDADVAGLNFWANGLTNGTFTVATAVTTIAAGAQNADLTTFNNRVSAAVAFTNALDTSAELVGYTGAAANAAATKFLNGITTNESLAAAIAPTALDATISGVINQINGQTYSLTAGVDTLVGTSANDVFNVLSVNGTTGEKGNNLTAFDSIDGGAGVDTLNLYVATGANDDLSGVTITNVENIVINGSDALIDSTVDASVFVGSNNITLNGAAATKVTGVTGQTVTLAGAGATSSNSVSYASSATAGTVALNNSAGTLTLTGSKLATATVTGTVKAASSTTPGTVTIVDGSTTDTIKTLNLALTSGATVNVAGATALTTIAAGNSSGGLSIAGIPTTVSSITTGSGNDTVSLNTAFTSTVKTASVTTGAGNDTITVNTTGTGTYTVNAGEGDDKINITAAQLTAGNKIDGGAGTDTIILTNNAKFTTGDYAVISAVVSNVEGMEFKNAVETLDASKITQFSTLTFDAASVVTGVSQAVVAHADLTASAAGYKPASDSADATYAGTLTVTADTAGSALVLNADSAIVNVNALRAAGTDVTIGGDLQTKLTVNLTNTTDSASSPTADTLASATITFDDDNNAALKAVTLTGNGTVTIDATNSGSLTTIDASALGGTLATGTSKGFITGGLVFTGNDSIAETITLGSGHDVITTNSTYQHMDTIAGFDATKEGTTGASTVDTLVFAGKTLDGAAAGGVTKMALGTADTTLDLAFVHAAAVSGAAAGSIVQFVFGGNTYLFSSTDTTLDATDFAIKLVGTVDLSTAFGVAPTTTA